MPGDGVGTDFFGHNVTSHWKACWSRTVVRRIGGTFYGFDVTSHWKASQGYGIETDFLRIQLRRTWEFRTGLTAI